MCGLCVQYLVTGAGIVFLRLGVLCGLCVKSLVTGVRRLGDRSAHIVFQLWGLVYGLCV